MRCSWFVLTLLPLFACTGKDGSGDDSAVGGSDAESPSDDTDSPPDDTAEPSEPPVWGEETTQSADFYPASDVPDTQLELIQTDYATASAAWGNFGPLEYWIIGTDTDAASEHDIYFCSVRREKDPSLPAEFDTFCMERDYNFTDYARDGGAGLNTRRSEYEEYSVFLVTLASKYPFPNETDYTVVTYHEYFHVVQNAHIDTHDEEERQELMVRNPWWSEGGAEYMAQLLYSRQPGVSSGYLKERMGWKMEIKSELEDGERFTDIPYSERARIAYDLGTWFIAFLVDKVGVEAYSIDFFDDLNELGWEGSFVENFGMSSEDMLADFEVFLALPLEEQLSIIP
jgi:hypothetical protein